MTMNFLYLIYKSIRKQGEFTEREYLKSRSRKVPFSEYAQFVQICPVFTGPVTIMPQFIYNFTILNYYISIVRLQAVVRYMCYVAVFFIFDILCS